MWKEKRKRGENWKRKGGRRKEDVQQSLQEDNADMMLLPSDLDWADWSLDSPTTSQASSG